MSVLLHIPVVFAPDVAALDGLAGVVAVAKVVNTTLGVTDAS